MIALWSIETTNSGTGARCRNAIEPESQEFEDFSALNWAQIDTAKFLPMSISLKKRGAKIGVLDTGGSRRPRNTKNAESAPGHQMGYLVKSDEKLFE